MKFGEQFPSLKGKDKITTKTFDVIFNDYWKQTDIQKHCLDKQKVRDLIKKFRHYSPTIFDDFEQELKL